LATATDPEVNVVPAIIVLETSALPEARVEFAAMMLPPARLVDDTIAVVAAKDWPPETATALTTLLEDAKLPAPRTLPAAIVVALTTLEPAAMVVPVDNTLPAAITLPEARVELPEMVVAETSEVAALKLLPFTTLPAEITLPAAKVLPASTTLPAARVVPAASIVLVAKVEPAATVLLEASTDVLLTDVDSARTVDDAMEAPFTTLPAAITVPADSTLPADTTVAPATVVEPATTVLPETIVAPAIVTALEASATLCACTGTGNWDSNNSPVIRAAAAIFPSLILIMISP
jgi:hypothetical protein